LLKVENKGINLLLEKDRMKNLKFDELPEEQAGGTGGDRKRASGDYLSRRSELRLECKALKERWSISEERRQRIIENLFSILSDPGASVRDRISACKTLLVADTANINWARLEAGLPDESENVVRIVLENGGSEDYGARLLREQYGVDRN
jgi:hypothetical protein